MIIHYGRQAPMTSELGIRKIFVEQHAVLATTGLGLVALGTIFIARVGNTNKGTEAFRDLCRAVGFSKSSVYGYSSRSKAALKAMIKRFGSPLALERSFVWSNSLDRPDDELAEAIEFVSLAIQELFGVRTMVELDAKLSHRPGLREDLERAERPAGPAIEALDENLLVFRDALNRLKAFDPAVETRALAHLRRVIDSRLSELGDLEGT